MIHIYESHHHLHHHLEEDHPVEDEGSGRVDTETNNNFTNACYHLFSNWQSRRRCSVDWYYVFHPTTCQYKAENQPPPDQKSSAYHSQPHSPVCKKNYAYGSDTYAFQAKKSHLTKSWKGIFMAFLSFSPPVALFSKSSIQHLAFQFPPACKSSLPGLLPASNFNINNVIVTAQSVRNTQIPKTVHLNFQKGSIKQVSSNYLNVT